MRSELSWHLMCSIKVSLTFLHSSKQTSPQEVKLSGLSLLVTLQPPSEFLLISEGHPQRLNFLSPHPGNTLCSFTTPSTAIRRNLVCLRVQTFSISWLVCVVIPVAEILFVVETTWAQNLYSGFLACLSSLRFTLPSLLTYMIPSLA